MFDKKKKGSWTPDDYLESKKAFYSNQVDLQLFHLRFVSTVAVHIINSKLYLPFTGSGGEVQILQFFQIDKLGTPRKITFMVIIFFICLKRDAGSVPYYVRGRLSIIIDSIKNTSIQTVVLSSPLE